MSKYEEGEVHEFEVGENEGGGRIDRIVAGWVGGGFSRTQVQDWIRDGFVWVGGKSVKPNYVLTSGEVVHVQIPEAEEWNVQAEPIELDIIYEDQDVIVINKPRGMVVHPAPGHIRGTLVNALLYHCRDLSGINGVLRPGIVHRIDKDTSGLIMAAKNDFAHQSLAEQLRVHTVIRRYYALAQGNVPHDHGTIDAPIGRDPKDRKLFTVTDKNAKDAVTHFSVLERFGNYTYLELKLETGRTHQIRVHMQYIGHPLAGDPMYGRGDDAPIDGQALHAGILGFVHPRTGKEVEFSVSLPEDMERLLTNLRNR